VGVNAGTVVAASAAAALGCPGLRSRPAAQTESRMTAAMLTMRRDRREPPYSLKISTFRTTVSRFPGYSEDRLNDEVDRADRDVARC
jgi:hypothetical protein